MYICVYIDTCIRIYIHTYLHRLICISACMCVSGQYMFICVHACVCVLVLHNIIQTS